MHMLQALVLECYMERVCVCVCVKCCQVEDLLESFTSDLGISGDQFTHACSQMLTSKVGQDNEVNTHTHTHTQR